MAVDNLGAPEMMHAVRTNRYATSKGGTPPFDGEVVEVMQAVLPEWTSYVFAAATLLGEAWLFVPVLAFAYWFGEPRRIAPLFGLVFGGLALVVVLKSAFAFPRPQVAPMLPPEQVSEAVRGGYAWAIRADGYGFPSGHAVGAVLTWGSLAAALRIGTYRARVGVAVTLVVLAAASRVALGVHYAADVVGGILVGLVLLFGWRVALQRVDRPVAVSLGAGLACAAVPILLGIGGSEPLYAFGAVGGALVTWHAVDRPIRPFSATPAGVALAVAGVGWFLAVGAVVGTAVPGPVGSVATTAAMAVAIFSWPTAVGSVRGRLGRAEPAG